MANKQISIKFCGGCNPKIDRGRLAAKLGELFVAKGHAISYNRLDVDIVIFLSGCTANCAQRYNGTDAAFVVVAGATVDSMAVEESQLAIEILSRVRD